MRVELENLTKKWGEVVGADSITLDINDGEFIAFLGPSGCGKTTTLLMIAGTVTLALVPVPLWVKLMVPLCAFPLVYFIYEWAMQGENIHTFETELPDTARRISQLLSVKVVAFGHTHRPRLVPLGRDCVFVDTGTWAPIMDPAHPDELAGGYRNYLLLVFHEGGHQLTFHSLLDGPCGQGGDCGNLR